MQAPFILAVLQFDRSGGGGHDVLHLGLPVHVSPGGPPVPAPRLPPLLRAQLRSRHQHLHHDVNLAHSHHVNRALSGHLPPAQVPKSLDATEDQNCYRVRLYLVSTVQPTCVLEVLD